MGSFVKCRPERPGQNGKLLQVNAGELLADRLALYEYLTVDRYDDGTPRQVGTLLIFSEDGLWKGCLHDRQEQRSAWASGSDIDAVLSALDADLRNGTAQWRRSGGSSGPRRPGRS